MDTTDNLLLPFILPAQAQKHVTHNEALRMLDAIVQVAVADRDLAAPPALPGAGARFIVAAPASGAWAGRENLIAAWQDGAWAFLAPQPGWLAWVADEGAFLVFTASGWQPLSRSLTALQALTLLGLGTTADAANPFAAKLNKALWTAKTAAEGGDGDLRYTLNKETAGDVVSFLLQTGYSGRAEIGLIGSDNLSLKVSPDGTAWSTALTVDRTTGATSFPLGALRVQVDKFTSSGTWTKPAWAKQLRVCMVSGGSGGGSGATRGAGVAVSGGAGGGPGLFVEATLDAAAVPATVPVTVGAGGTGGVAVSAGDANGVNGGVGGASLFGSLLRTLMSPNQGNGGSTATVAGGATLGTYALPYVPNTQGGSGTVAAGTSGGNGAGAAPGAGGGGGGVSALNAFGAGGGGGYGALGAYPSGTGAVAAGGAADGAAGTTLAGPPITTHLFGAPGGGGGAGSAAGAGGAGGSGTVPGGGGGGGGAARNGSASGAGGTGGRGEVWVVAIG